MTQNRAAFSLVELSIVLVILGLLVGGILSGQSLIRAAELRSVTTQYQKYIAAVNGFKDKYFALPGDMANATSFWGAAHATPATCVTTASTTALTCNGNGDGWIFSSAGSDEWFRFWQHLANAGLIEGQYNGVAVGGGYGATTANSPAGRMSNTLWFPDNFGTLSGLIWWFDGSYGNTFEFGGPRAAADPLMPMLKPEELWNIDSKLDDGKPAYGKIRASAYSVGLSGCTTTAANNPATLSADYLLTSTSLNCSIAFANAF